MHTVKNVLTIASIRKAFQEYGWFLALYTITAIVAFLLTRDTTLTQFDGHIVSSATLHMQDVNARVAAYFGACGVALASVFLMLFAARVCDRLLVNGDRAILQYTSFAGVVAWFLALFTGVFDILVVIAVIHCIVLLNGIAQRIHPVLNTLPRAHYYTFIISLAFVLVSIFYDTQLFAGLPLLHNALSFWLLGALVVYVLCVAITRIIPRQHVSSEKVMRTLLWVAAPLMLVPLASLISTEAAYILFQHGIEVSRNLLWCIVDLYIVLLVVLCALVRSKSWIPESDSIIRIWYIPLFIISLACIALYQPVLTNIPELFEPANPALAIQQLFQFGKIPYLQNFNAHGLSDAFFGSLYALLNNQDFSVWMHYDFLQRVIEYLLIYAVITRITRNMYLGAGAVLLLPTLDLLFPPYFAFALAALLGLWWVMHKQTVWRYTVLGLFLIFLIFWRIDIGSAAIPAVLGAWLASQWCEKKSHIQWRSVLYALGITAAIVCISSAVLFALTQTHPLVWARDMLHILNSNQTFGYVALWNTFGVKEAWNYIALPLILFAATVGFLVYAKGGSLNTESQTHRSVIISAWIFFALFFFVNVQRGLVRHSLLEQQSFYLISFGIFLIGWLAWYGCRHYGRLAQAAAFVAVTTIVVYQLSVYAPDSMQMNTYDAWKERTRYVADVQKVWAVPQDRSVVSDQFAHEEFDDTVKFLNANLTPEQTFFDLSNNPMLYVYAQRETPFFPNHFMLMHDDYLQMRAVEQLETYDVPVVMFADVVAPMNLDGVQFQTRYYHVVEYIYEHYTPYAVIDGREVWVRRGWIPAVAVGEDGITGEGITETQIPSHTHLHSLPAVWGMYEQRFDTAQVLKQSDEFTEFVSLRLPVAVGSDALRFVFEPLVGEQKTGQYLLIDAVSTAAGDVVLRYGQDDDARGELKFSVLADGKEHRYAIRLSTQHQWYAQNNNWISLTAPQGDMRVMNMRVVHLPDAQ